jgi:hypothetical protein
VDKARRRGAHYCGTRSNKTLTSKQHFATLIVLAVFPK